MSEKKDIEVYVTKFRVPADHPSLPGHFPGHPVVPAALLLSHVLDCAQDRFGDAACVIGVDHAKFLAPLLPDQEVLVTVSLQPTHLHFRIERGTTAIAHGSLLLASEPRS